VGPRQIIGSGIAASAIAHLSVLMLIIFFAEVHPFGSVTAEPIAVDIVSPKDVAETLKLPEPLTEPEIPPKPEIHIPLISDLPTEAKSASAAKSAASASAPPPAAASQAAAASQPAAASQAAARPQKQAALQPSNPAQQQAAATPQQQQQPSQPQPPPPQTEPPQPQSASPAPLPPAIPQAPDVTVKYGVSLGLPTASSSGDFDAPASKSADVASNLVAEFRRHLKTCSKLPASIAPSDDVRIKMRISMTPDGKLIGEPILIEASASMKGPLLMRSAMSALEACQPYAMLPSDRYGEWKSLDLTFTPRDFIGG
jgi:hypothetical protein